MLDSRDMRLLTLMQMDAEISLSEMAERLHLSPSACSRRVTRLKAEGYIVGLRAQLDRKRLNLNATVFALVKTTQHTPQWLEDFRHAIQGIGEIVEAHRLAGNLDYCLKIIVSDISHYDRIYKQLVGKIGISDVSAYISMETLKDSPSLPLGSIQD